MRRCRIVSIDLTAALLFLVLLTYGAEAKVIDTIAVESWIPVVDSVVEIVDVQRVDNHWVVGREDGRITAMDMQTGEEVLIAQLPLRSWIRKLMIDDSSASILALCEDGSLYKVDSLRNVARLGNTSRNYTDAVLLSGKALVSGTFGVSEIEVAKGNERALSFIDIPSNLTALMCRHSDTIIIGTTLGTIYRYGREGDAYVKLDSAYAGQDPVQSIVPLGNLVLLTQYSRCALFDHNLVGMIWRPDFVLNDFTAKPSTRVTVSDVCVDDNQALLVMHGTSTLGEEDKHYIIRYDIQSGQFEDSYDLLIKSNSNAQQVAVRDQKSIIAGGHGYYRLSDSNAIIYEAKRKESSSGAWESLQLDLTGTITTGRSNEDSSLTVASSDDVRKWESSTTVKLADKVAACSFATNLGAGYVVAESNKLHTVSKAGELLNSCEVGSNVVSAGWVYSGDTSVWTIGSKQVSVVSPNGCTKDSASANIYLKKPIIPTGDPNKVIVQEITGRVLLAERVPSGLELKELPLPENMEDPLQFSGVFGNNLVFTRVSSNYQFVVGMVTLNLETLENHVVDFSSDEQIKYMVPIVLSEDLAVMFASDTLWTFSPLTGATNRYVTKLLGVSPDHQRSVVGMHHGLILVALSQRRLALIPKPVQTSVEDLAVSHVFFQTVYPNPCSNAITVTLGKNVSADLNGTRLTIVDMLGREMLSIPITESWRPDQLSMTLNADLSDVPNGSYLLVVRNRGHVESRSLHVIR